MGIFGPQSLQVLHGLFVSKEAAYAIVKAMVGDKQKCFVRITDVRPGIGETFHADCALLFTLRPMTQDSVSERATQFTFDERVCVCMDEEYSPFLLGGRILYYEERVDAEKGKAFVLWPLKRYLAYLELLRGGSDDNGAGS